MVKERGRWRATGKMVGQLALAVASLALASCHHESLDERVGRECAEYTARNCPARLQEGLVLDSMSYERDTRTIRYCYSLSGILDTTALDTTAPREIMLNEVRNATNLKAYKDAGFNFAHTYYSTKNRGQVLMDLFYAPGDYRGAGPGE